MPMGLSKEKGRLDKAFCKGPEQAGKGCMRERVGTYKAECEWEAEDLSTNQNQNTGMKGLRRSGRLGCLYAQVYTHAATPAASPADKWPVQVVQWESVCPRILLCLSSPIKIEAAHLCCHVIGSSPLQYSFFEPLLYTHALARPVVKSIPKGCRTHPPV